MGIDLVETTVQVVTRASQAFTPKLEIDDAEKAPFIAEKEVNFCVPQILQDVLTPSLGELGFEIKNVELPGLPGTPPAAHNVIKNRAAHRSMLHFPKGVLTEPLVWQSVANVFQRFQLKNQTLLILSEGLEATHPFYVGVGQGLWKSQYQITAQFLPWSFLMPSTPMSASEMLSVLPALLQLEDLITAARDLPPVSPSALEITALEISKLATILGDLPAFFDEGKKGWRLYMEQAGLKDLIGKIDVSGPNTQTKAYGVITQLDGRKPVDAYPNDQVLGLFLCAVLTTTKDLKPDDANQLRSILKTYNLAPSFKDALKEAP